MPLSYDLRTRTALVCGALALALAVSVLLGGRVRRPHFFLAGFAADIGLWYLAQSFYGFFNASIWQRFSAVLAVLLPQFAIHLFQAMVPREKPGPSRLLRAAWISAVPMLVLVASPLANRPAARLIVFAYVFVWIAAGLWELGQRGKNSPSRATQRRVRFLVVIGGLAGTASVVDFAWFLGVRSPPVGAVLSIVFLFVLVQSVRYERLLDIYEMFGRLVVATAVAFLIAFIFYVLLTFIGGFNTVYLNAVLAATVVLVLFEPLQARVEEQIQRLFFRERFDLEGAIADVRKKLVHTLEVGEMGEIVLGAIETSRRATAAALYLRDGDGTGFDVQAALGAGVPARIEVATARVLLERLEAGSLSIEEVERDVRERKDRGDHRSESGEAMLAAAGVLGSLRSGVLIGVRAEGGDLVGLLAVADDRVRDALSVEEVALLEQLATQVGVVVENSRLYAQMKERDRLAVLGQMAAGLAHEIRNPLGAIKGAAQLLSEPAPGEEIDASSREFIGIILEEVDRLNRVVGSVLDLARSGDRSVAPVDVNAAVRRTMQVLSAEPIVEGLTIDLVLAQDLPRVAIDPEQLRQVLMNLVRNALQAVGTKGRVTVTTRSRAPARRPRGKIDPASVEVHVADTGPGISAKALDKLFIPFFTTKEKGTGLGLAISQRIVQSAGGRIEVRSSEGKGSTFTILLPAAMEALGTPKPGPADPVAASSPPSAPTLAGASTPPPSFGPASQP